MASVAAFAETTHSHLNALPDSLLDLARDVHLVSYQPSDDVCVQIVRKFSFRTILTALNSYSCPAPRRSEDDEEEDEDDDDEEEENAESNNTNNTKENNTNNTNNNHNNGKTNNTNNISGDNTTTSHTATHGDI